MTVLGAWSVLHASLLIMNNLNKTEFTIFISLMWSLLSKVVVALLFYVHGKHLRSCRDGQLT